MAMSEQIPTQSGFGARSEPEAVLAGVDLSGKTALVTGGYSGLGLETVKALVSKGARVFVPARSVERARASLAELPGVEVGAMDLADLASVRSYAQAVSGVVSRLDLLINNAGIMACPEARVGPGWESQFGVNHMGHFALTQALMPLLGEGSRVVALSSAAHRMHGMRWEDPQWTQGYDKWKAYAQSKTANALFANALSRRLRERGGLAFSLHPGAILTPLQRHLPREEMVQLGWVDDSGELTEGAARIFKTPTQGCTTTLWAATSPALAGKPGVYCEDCDVAVPYDRDKSRTVGVKAWAVDDEQAERLWELSEGLLAGT